MDESYQKYFNMFVVLGKCRKDYLQTANVCILNITLIAKENRIRNLNSYRNVLLDVIQYRRKNTKENSY